MKTQTVTPPHLCVGVSVDGQAVACIHIHDKSSPSPVIGSDAGVGRLQLLCAPDNSQGADGCWYFGMNSSCLYPYRILNILKLDIGDKIIIFDWWSFRWNRLFCKWNRYKLVILCMLYVIKCPYDTGPGGAVTRTAECPECWVWIVTRVSWE